MSELQDALDQIRALCNRLNVVLIGTCASEGIYGEILIAKADEDNGWRDWQKQLTNKLDKGDLVEGIGDVL